MNEDVYVIAGWYFAKKCYVCQRLNKNILSIKILDWAIALRIGTVIPRLNGAQFRDVTVGQAKRKIRVAWLQATRIQDWSIQLMTDLIILSNVL